jgi:hypothetical protein
VRCQIDGCDYYAGSEEEMTDHLQRSHGSSLFDFGADPNGGED